MTPMLLGLRNRRIAGALAAMRSMMATLSSVEPSSMTMISSAARSWASSAAKARPMNFA